MTAIMDNNTNATALGLQAAAKWNSAQNSGDAGDALAINAMFIAASTMTFSATVERKGSDVDETIDFDLQALASPVFNKDGTRDNKAMSARSLCVAERLFGITTLNNAIKQRIGRALSAALYLDRSIGDVEGREDMVSMKGNKLVVPYGLVHKAPIAGVDSDNDVAIYEAMKDKACTLDGKNGASLAELSRRAKPETVKRAAGEAKDKGASLMESIKFVQAIMLQNVNPNADESDVALSSEMRKALYDLQLTVASYFSIDPLEEVEEKIAA